MNILNNIFEWVLESGLRASLLVPVVLAARWLLRKHLPAGWRYALWLPVLVALLVPALPIVPFLATQWLTNPVSPVATMAGEAPSTVRPAGTTASDAPITLRTINEPHPTERSLPADGVSSGFAATPPEPIGGVDSSTGTPIHPPPWIDWRAIALSAWLVGAAVVGLSILASFAVTCGG
jgi:beta-lactamase regulating signal transducer with metallopeptidase domain